MTYLMPLSEISISFITEVFHNNDMEIRHWCGCMNWTFVLAMSLGCQPTSRLGLSHSFQNATETQDGDVCSMVYSKCWTGVFFLSTLTVGSWWSQLVVMAASSLLPVMKVLCDGLTLCEWSHEVMITLIVMLSSKYCCRENSLQSHRYWDVWNDVQCLALIFFLTRLCSVCAMIDCLACHVSLEGSRCLKKSRDLNFQILFQDLPMLKQWHVLVQTSQTCIMA